mmetsp:Transcript_2602/g.7818  ORF Transcript_2602/g.7818 Transcript_2602/m.7818 type:complete len:298 (-) Transcript_2602:165-1058(-)
MRVVKLSPEAELAPQFAPKCGVGILAGPGCWGDVGAWGKQRRASKFLLTGRGRRRGQLHLRPSRRVGPAQVSGGALRSLGSFSLRWLHAPSTLLLLVGSGPGVWRGRGSPLEQARGAKEPRRGVRVRPLRGRRRRPRRARARGDGKSLVRCPAKGEWVFALATHPPAALDFMDGLLVRRRCLVAVAGLVEGGARERGLGACHHARCWLSGRGVAEACPPSGRLLRLRRAAAGSLRRHHRAALLRAHAADRRPPRFAPAAVATSASAQGRAEEWLKHAPVMRRDENGHSPIDDTHVIQ